MCFLRTIYPYSVFSLGFGLAVSHVEPIEGGRIVGLIMTMKATSC